MFQKASEKEFSDPSRYLLRKHFNTFPISVKNVISYPEIAMKTQQPTKRSVIRLFPAISSLFSITRWEEKEYT